MELTSDEKEMLCRIANNPHTGGAYKRATRIDLICPTKADKALLETLRHKGLAEPELDELAKFKNSLRLTGGGFGCGW